MGADRASPARSRIWVVESLLEELHQTAPSAGVGAHEIGLYGSPSPDSRPLFLIVDVGGAGGSPTIGPPLHRSLDGDDLEQCFETTSAHASNPLESRHAHGLGTLFEGPKDLLDIADVRDGSCGEELPKTFVGFGRQQDRVGTLDRSSGPPNLLVVSNGRVRRSDVNTETEIRLVVAHS